MFLNSYLPSSSMKCSNRFSMKFFASNVVVYVFYLFSLALTRMNPAIIMKVRPVMPLTSLPDKGIPVCPHVTKRASIAKMRANIKTSNPATILFH